MLRRETIPLLQGNPKLRDRVEEFFRLSRSLTSSTIQRDLNRERLKVGHWTRTTAFVCNALATAFDYAELKRRSRRSSPSRDSHLLRPLYEPVSSPLTARLFAAYDTGKSRDWPEGVSFAARTLLPPELVKADRDGRSFAVMPLASGPELLGHLLLDFEVTHIFARSRGRGRRRRAVRREAREQPPVLALSAISPELRRMLMPLRDERG